MSEDQDVIDDAVETATERIRAAHQDFVATPPEEDEAIVKAAEVERRAEDLSILADEAADNDTAGDG